MQPSGRHNLRSRSPLGDLLNPDVESESAIRTVCNTAMGISFAIAGFTVLAVLAQWLSGTTIVPFSLVDAGIFTLTGAGIGRLSRIAAVVGLVFYVVEQAYGYLTGFGGFPILPILFTCLFVGAVRATFAYGRLRKKAPAAPRGPVGQPVQAS